MAKPIDSDAAYLARKLEYLEERLSRIESAIESMKSDLTHEFHCCVGEALGAMQDLSNSIKKNTQAKAPRSDDNSTIRAAEIFKRNAKRFQAEPGDATS